MDAERCRLILLANPNSASPSELSAIAETKALACCILYNLDMQEKEFLGYCTSAVGNFQSHDIPVLIADNTQVMGRSGADGLYLEKDRSELGNMIEQFSPDRMIGCGNFKKRHGILEAGEAGVDFIFLGKLGGDTKPEPHPRNLQMAQWCSEILDVPNIMLAGNAIESVVECARTGAEFVAVEHAVFGGDIIPHEAIVKADQLLEEHAPRFEEAEV